MARTKNRGNNTANSPTSYKSMRWRLGKYIRLSKEDLLRGRDESNSVVNQRLLLEQYRQTLHDPPLSGPCCANGNIQSVLHRKAA